MRPGLKDHKVSLQGDCEFKSYGFVFRQRNELQRQRQGPLRGGRCLPLRHPEGGAWPGSTGPRSQTEFHQKSAAGPLPADGQ